MTIRRLLPLLLLGLALFAPFAPAWADEADEDEAPKRVDVVVSAKVEDKDASATGRFPVELIFKPKKTINRAYRIELRLLAHGRELLVLDHSPKVSTTKWKLGSTQKYTVDVPVPVAADPTPGTTMHLYVGFFDPGLDRTVPTTMDVSHFAGRVEVAQLVVPELGPVDQEPALQAILQAAAALADQGRKPDAWSTLELGIRRAAEDPTKARLRNALIELGHFEPRPISMVEAQIVGRRIEAEKVRYLRLMAGRFRNRKNLYAALRILEAIGGTLADQSDQAVIGALAEAKRTQVALDDIRREITRTSDEDKAEATKAIEKHGYSKAALRTGEAWFKAGHFGKAKALLWDLSTSSEKDVRFKARETMDEVEKAWLAQMPPEEQKLVDDAVNHPAFGRTGTVATHNFIYIGPRTLVEGIPTQSRLRFDLAYVFQTDLFGRMPNPGGNRITVYFKELWDFGGGQAGGNLIDIGRADPDRTGYRVDTGLMYHELTHCIDDTNPILAGWREGLANMGAAYTFEALGQEGDRLHAFRGNLLAFKQDYLERDLEYWRMQSYGPSAGFFLHFVAAHSKAEWGYDWKPYRQFFREYRAAPVRDGREPYVARAFAYFLMRAFGDQVFDDLIEFRFPLVPSDREAVKLEVDAFAKGDWRVSRSGPEFEDAPNAQLPRDLVFRELISRANSGDADAAREIGRTRLGIIHDWWVIGPFSSRGADPRAVVFPPQQVIDLAGEYPSESNVCKWRRAGDTSMVTIDPVGWVGIHFNYQENTADYGLTHVTVPEDMEAFAHVRSDDDFALYVNDKLVNDYLNRGQNASDYLWWRGPAERAPDMQKLRVRLEKGRNKVLLKIKNRRGDAGFIFALARIDGKPIEGMTTDLDPPPSGADTAEAAPKKSDWKTSVKHGFKKKSFKTKLETKVGNLVVKNDLMYGESTGKGVQWRKYTVRPGFPKDSPSNLFWIKPKYTQDVVDFRLALDLVPDGQKAPKLVVTFQGEGGADGLSGWNLIVHPDGKKRVAARLERYDNLVHQAAPVDCPKAEVMPLVLTYVGESLTVTLGEVVIFDHVPIVPIPGRSRIGVSTFGPSLKFEGFKLEALKRK